MTIVKLFIVLAFVIGVLALLVAANHTAHAHDFIKGVDDDESP
jgi:hypothetical protein